MLMSYLGFVSLFNVDKLECILLGKAVQERLGRWRRLPGSICLLLKSSGAEQAGGPRRPRCPSRVPEMSFQGEILPGDARSPAAVLPARPPPLRPPQPRAGAWRPGTESGQRLGAQGAGLWLRRFRGVPRLLPRTGILLPLTALRVSLSTPIFGFSLG